METTLYSDAPKVLGPAPEFGVTLKMDADFHRLRWYGPGPISSAGSRYSGRGSAPQLLSPPRPICIRDARITV